ncbi:MAG: IPExxxVDY family protein [Bacteroidetes bacterium]|nr:IPExxxVDY family protein [Bacteroidota bacterium]
MAKTILKFDTDEEFEFLLVGIICQHKDYRLCHELNRKLEINLVREKDYEVNIAKRMNPALFSFFKFENDEQDLFFVFENKGKHSILIPEQKQIDFFLMIKESFQRQNITELVNTIKQIPIVLGAYPIDPLNLKSREYFLLHT